MENCTEFHQAFQSIKFKENDSDPISLAQTKRQLIALNFYGSSYLNEDNSVTEFGLISDLEEYSSVVDRKDFGGVNNFADYVLALLSNCQNDDKKNWKTSLDCFSLKDHLKSLPCSNDLNCIQSKQLNSAHFNDLKKAFEEYKAVDKQDHCKKLYPEEVTKIHQSPANHSSINHGQIHKTTFNQVSVFKGTSNQNQNSFCQSSANPPSIYQPPVNPPSVYQPPAIPPSVNQPSTNQSTIYQSTIKQSFQRSKSFENSVPEPKIARFQLPTPKNETNYAPPNKPEEPERPNGFNAFRTARDELQIQNQKKYGKGGQNNYNNEKGHGGLVKKSLGTRKGGVFGKFQPPVKSKDTRNDVNDPAMSMEVDEIVDEKLKNIDPAMIELIRNEIMDCGSKVTWDDIAGLHLAKSTIQEIVVWPMLRPDIFTGLRRPPKGILLFGPPGTGKTLIGKCIASQSNSTFFSISASSLTSKWVGDGEKMVRTLFAVAKVHQPSVVFIDEIDSLLSQRSDSEHECSRRIKTEFLVQLDGAGTGDEDRILIIGATNRPQELDEAARRRLVKRLYIPLPDENARKQIIENLIASERHCLSEEDIDTIAKLTKGYSGADVKNLCQEASLGPIRSIAPSMIQCINPSDVRPLNSKDFESALCRIKSSVSESDLDIYLAWDKQYGCGSTSHP